MKIIDAHVHFWNPAVLDYPWLEDVPRIQQAHLPRDYHQATASAGIDIAALVFVEADCAQEQALREVEWVETLAQQENRLRGIVAAAPMEQGSKVRPHLEALREHALVRGVRRLIQGEPPGFSTTPEFIQAVQMLPEFDFSFDLCLKHSQFPDVLSLIEACPETAFILDHIGKPDIAGGLLDPWRKHIDRLAALPQVIGCKLSGIITEADWQQWTEDDLQPYVTHVLEAFGPARLLYGSDWPVSVLAGGYGRWWETVTALTATLTDAERAQIFEGTAKRVYRL